MTPNQVTPTPIRSVEEQLRRLYLRRSAVDRLIRSLETYQRLNSQKRPGKFVA